MRLIINTSNLYVGGGVQVAVSFINELKNIGLDNVYHVYLSCVINEQIDTKSFPENFHFYIINKSPSSLKSRKKIVKKLNFLESKINPDIVFSVFGPTYWRPKNKHIMGFALVWLINPESSVFGELPLIKRIINFLEIKYKAYHVKRNADYYITETDDAKSRLARIHNIEADKIYVVGNAYNSFFDQAEFKKVKFPLRKDKEFRLITISHNYVHKNLKIIRDVIPYLRDKELDYKFVLTIDKISYELLFGDLKEHVINLGAINSNLCPSAYEQSDALFLPTLLECFTASYPEAMKMNKPILTSNLSFARGICKDAALYFEPQDPLDIANKIIELSLNRSLQKTIIEKGNDYLGGFETAQSRARKYVEVFEHVSK